MQAEVETVDVATLPDLAALAERVKATGTPLCLVRGDEELALLQPVKKKRRRSVKGRPTSPEDPLWDIVGMGHSEGPGDVSTNKKKYLAEAYLPKPQ